MDSNRTAHTPQTSESPGAPTPPASVERYRLIEEGRSIVARASQSLGLTISPELANIPDIELREIAYAEALKETEP